jgi:hypothetical protein
MTIAKKLPRSRKRARAGWARDRKYKKVKEGKKERQAPIFYFLSRRE